MQWMGTKGKSECVCVCVCKYRRPRHRHTRPPNIRWQKYKFRKKKPKTYRKWWQSWRSSDGGTKARCSQTEEEVGVRVGSWLVLEYVCTCTDVGVQLTWSCLESRHDRNNHAKRCSLVMVCVRCEEEEKEVKLRAKQRTSRRSAEEIRGKKWIAFEGQVSGWRTTERERETKTRTQGGRRRSLQLVPGQNLNVSVCRIQVVVQEKDNGCTYSGCWLRLRRKKNKITVVECKTNKQTNRRWMEGISKLTDTHTHTHTAVTVPDHRRTTEQIDRPFQQKESMNERQIWTTKRERERRSNKDVVQGHNPGDSQWKD